MTLAGAPHARAADKPGCRWGRTKGSVRFHGGKVEMERPRVRSKTTGKELSLPSWQEAAEGGWLEQWAKSLMLMHFATRKVGRAVRLAALIGCPQHIGKYPEPPDNRPQGAKQPPTGTFSPCTWLRLRMITSVQAEPVEHSDSR